MIFLTCARLFPMRGRALEGLRSLSFPELCGRQKVAAARLAAEAGSQECRKHWKTELAGGQIYSRLGEEESERFIAFSGRRRASDWEKGGRRWREETVLA